MGAVERCRYKFLMFLQVFLVFFVILTAGCGKTEHEQALEIAKQLTLTDRISDTEAVESLQASERLLDHLTQVKIDAARWRVHALRKLAERYMNMGMLELAEEELDKLIELQPVQERWHVMKGQLYSRWAIVDREKIPQAERSFQIALELDEKSLPGRYGLAVLYAFHANQKELGRKLLQEIAFEQKIITRTRPYVKQARFALARLEFEDGNYREAEKVLRETVEMTGLSRDSRFMGYKNLGQVYEHQGATEMAIQSYRQAHKFHEYDPEVNRALERLSGQ